MPIGRVPFYTNEQYASQSLNALQDIAENALEELAGFPLRTVGLGTVGGAPGAGSQPIACVLGGLDVDVSGTSLLIRPGLLSTTQSTLISNPSACGAYLALLEQEASVSLPSPVGDTWYLVCATPELQSDAAVAVNVFDPAARRPVSPTPSLVKRERGGMRFQVLQGSGTTLPIPDDTWVALWGVFRPGGGGAIDPSNHLIDLRPIQPLKRPLCGPNILHNSWRYTTALKINTHLQLDEIELYATNPSGIHPTVDPMLFVNPADAAPVALEWWYLYLARYRPLGALCVPRVAQHALPGMQQQGLLIFSKVPPRAGNGAFDQDSPLARTNSAPLRATVPFADHDIAVGDAMCFGALRRNSSNSGWRFAQAEGDHVTQTPIISGTQSVPNGTATAITSAPPMARAIDLQVICTTPGPTGVDISGATPLGPGTIIFSTLGATFSADGPLYLEAHDLPVAETGLTLTLNAGSSATFQAVCRGYRF